MVEAHGLSDPGPVRRTNEDSFISDTALQLFVVADGMGGHSAGEVASGLAVANAGDSRLYLFADGRLTQLTHDDSWAATVLAAQGKSGPAGRPPSSMHHMLTNVLGAREEADVHLSEHDLSGGEMILLCSDGLHGVLDDSTLQMMLSAGGSPVEIVPQLIEAALTRGAKDNVTAVLARYDGE